MYGTCIAILYTSVCGYPVYLKFFSCNTEVGKFVDAHFLLVKIKSNFKVFSELIL
jgi:hypothetical protein